MLAASGGGAATYAYDTLVTRSKLSIDNLCNGLISGLVASSCGCAHTTYPAAFLSGVVGGVAYVAAARAVLRAQIDDAIGAIAVHGASGFASTVFLGLVATNAPFDGTRCGTRALDHVGLLNDKASPLLWIQFYGACAIVAFVAVATRLALEVVSCVVPVRVPRAHELVGLDLAIHGFCPAPPAETEARQELLEDLEKEIDERPGDFYATRTPLAKDELDPHLTHLTYFPSHFPFHRQSSIELLTHDVLRQSQGSHSDLPDSPKVAAPANDFTGRRAAGLTYTRDAMKRFNMTASTGVSSLTNEPGSKFVRFEVPDSDTGDGRLSGMTTRGPQTPLDRASTRAVSLSTIDSSNGANSEPDVEDVLVRCSDEEARPSDATTDSAAFFS